MENCSNHRIARIIALIDELWSVIDLLFTFIIHFGGEHVNGIFYQLELQADLGLLHPDQVMGKRALMGLLFFLSLLVNLLWIFAAFILFKATDTTNCTASCRKRIQYCRIWLSFSVVLLALHLCNMLIYIKESFLQMGLALIAFLTRSVFLYFVRKFMRELELTNQRPMTAMVPLTPIRSGPRPRPHHQGSRETGHQSDILLSPSSSASPSPRHTNNNAVENNNARKYMIVSNHQNHSRSAQIRSNNSRHSEVEDLLSSEQVDQRAIIDPQETGSGSSRTIITLNPLGQYPN